MSENKKYYWLKLKDFFFDLPEMKALEKYRNRAACQIFYLRLLCIGKYYKRGYRITPYVCQGFKPFENIALHFDLPRTEAEYIAYILVKQNLILLTDKEIVIRDINTNLERDRECKKYREWRTTVFNRDFYTCQECGVTGVKLNAHHIEPWALNPQKRHDIDNGITLCFDCHKRKHHGN